MDPGVGSWIYSDDTLTSRMDFHEPIVDRPPVPSSRKSGEYPMNYLTILLQFSQSKGIFRMPNADDQTQQQLKEYQVGHRASLRDKYGLTEDAANAIPLDSTLQMEIHAKLLQKVPANRANQSGQQSSGGISMRSTLKHVDNFLNQRYHGPKERATQ